MYEVFLNERKIVISGPGNTSFVKEAVITENLKSVEDVKNWFLDFVSSKTRLAVLHHHSPEKFWRDTFLPAFKTISAAGGIVIRKNKLLFIFRNDKWDLPKGKIDFGENAEEAAIREVAEECGISGHQITKKLPSTFHVYQSPYKDSCGQWILKETHWFEMNYSGSESGSPQTLENISEIRWFSKNELDVVLSNTFESLKVIILFYTH
jgi:8-oxo-dGTP pyrophosphatase MutT (NUDIX family)